MSPADDSGNFAGKRTTAATQATTATTAGTTTVETTNSKTTHHVQTNSSLHTTTAASVVTTTPLCAVTSGEYDSFINNNFEWLTAKCHVFQTCTDELYKSENFHHILAGENIRLRNICGFLYQTTSGIHQSAHSQCPAAERDAIKQVLGKEVTNRLRNSSAAGNDAARTSWGRLQVCLDNVTEGGTDLDKVCRLKGNSTRDLCNSTDVETTTESFFNLHLRQLHCSCKAFTNRSIQANRFPLVAVVGGACALLLLLMLIVVIVVLCVRHRRLQRRLKFVSKSREDKTSPADDFGPLYYEANAPCQELDARHKRTRRGQRPTHKPPPLPSRNVPPGLLAGTSSNEYEYLELLPDVIHPLSQQPLRAAQGSGTSRGQGPSQAYEYEMANPIPRGKGSSQARPYEMAKQILASPASARKMNAAGSSQDETYFEKIDWNSVTETTGRSRYCMLGGKAISRVKGGAELQVLSRQPGASEKGEGRGSHKDPQYFELEEVSTTRVEAPEVRGGEEEGANPMPEA